MNDLNIHPGFGSSELTALAARWDRAKNCKLRVMCSDESEVRQLFRLILSIEGSGLFFAILSDIAELDITPADVLEEIFQFNDTATLESVCLRSDLNPAMSARCDPLRMEGRISHPKA